MDQENINKERKTPSHQQSEPNNFCFPQKQIDEHDNAATQRKSCSS